MFAAYLFTRLDAINSVFGGLILFSIIVGLVCLVCLIYSENTLKEITSDRWRINDEKNDKITNINDNVKMYIRWLKRSIYCLIFGIILAILTPNMKEMAFIYAAPKIIANENVKSTVSSIPEVSDLALEYIKTFMKKSIKDLDNTNEEKAQ